MKKSEIITRLLSEKVVVVVRGNDYQEGYNISKSCIAGGIKGIEVAYTNPKASSIIEELSKQENVIVGAGTVLDASTARSAILSGAQFIVSPCFNKEVAILSNRYGIPYIPGCMTITEMVQAMEYGSEVIKLFPGNAYDPSFIKSVLSPLPQVSIMVTGGVSLDNAVSWLNAGASMIGIGGEFNELGAKKEFDKITLRSMNYKKSVEELL